MTTLVVRGALPLLFKRYALFRISQMHYTVLSHYRFKQFAKTPNAATSPQNPNPEPPGKPGTPVRGIGGNAVEICRIHQFDILEFDDAIAYGDSQRQLRNF